MQRLKKFFDKHLIKRKIIFWWQRQTRGWDDSETWSMDNSLAKIILPPLQVYKDINTMFPWTLTMDTWNKVIDEIIWGFQWFASGKQYNFDYIKEVDQANRAHDAIELFCKYYKYLWFSTPNVWGGSATISTQKYIAKLILPRLQRFQELRAGYPTNMTDEEWGTIINKMIYGFIFYASDNQSDYDPHDIKVQEGIELFGKYYGTLWW